MFLNRFKYTTYSRHFTTHRVLKTIAGALQPHLRTGDTFVDFACGLNTFAPLLKDPGTGEPLNAVAFDIFSPVAPQRTLLTLTLTLALALALTLTLTRSTAPSTLRAPRGCRSTPSETCPQASQP